MYFILLASCKEGGHLFMKLHLTMCTPLLLSGLPWFLQTCVIAPGSRVKVLHKGILYSTLTLLTTVVFLIGAAHSNNWKMDKRLGCILLFWYFVVMAVASLYETNILGDFNPLECESNW